LSVVVREIGSASLGILLSALEEVAVRRSPAQWGSRQERDAIYLPRTPTSAVHCASGPLTERASSRTRSGRLGTGRGPAARRSGNGCPAAPGAGRRRRTRSETRPRR